MTKPLISSRERLLQRIRALESRVNRDNRAAAMQESEERYRRLVETMGDGLSEIDEAGVTTYANGRLCEMWGYSREEILGRPVTDFLDKENRRILREQLSLRRQGSRTPYEIVWNRKDGQKLHTLMTPTPYFDADGRFKGSFAVITDISARKREQEALKKSHSELKQRLMKRTSELDVKTGHLEEVNTALRVLLKKREEDKKELEERMLLNVRELIKPYLEVLKKSPLGPRQRAYLEIVESTLEDILSPFLRGLSQKYLRLTPAEIQVADLIRHGHTSKEIAGMLNLSPKTIETHRKSIRAKIGIKNKKANLRAQLAAIR